MMKLLVGLCCSALLLIALPLRADEAGWALLERVQQSVRQRNFDTSFVILKGNQVESYRWLHGREQDAEIEHLIPMFAEGVDILRRNEQVYYLLSERPSLVTHSQNIKELPALLYQPPSRLRQLYNAVLGSASMVDGRSAQLLRLSATSAERYHYWLWVDAETGFPLRIDTIAEQNGTQNLALEIWQVTHLRMTADIPDTLLQLLQIELPDSSTTQYSPAVNTLHRLNWLPDGYQVVADPVQIPQLQPEIQSYWLLSDGLHHISVFVQPGHRLPEQAYRDGALTIYVQSGPAQDVTVIGPVKVETAQRLAASVSQQ